MPHSVPIHAAIDPDWNQMVRGNGVSAIGYLDELANRTWQGHHTVCCSEEPHHHPFCRWALDWPQPALLLDQLQLIFSKPVININNMM